MSRRLLTFIGIGIIVYLVDISFNSDNANKTIYISSSELNSLLNAWQAQVGRAPNNDEIDKIINSWIEEEILYREALALGLDNDDQIVKRRLVQKLTFLKQESINALPSSEDLNQFYQQYRQNYYVEPRYSFIHHYFAKNKNTAVRAAQAMEAIKQNTIIQSDPFIKGSNFNLKTYGDIHRIFGTLIAETIANSQPQAQPNQWVGPLASTYGQHIINIQHVSQGFYISQEQLGQQLQNDYLEQQKSTIVEAFVGKIKSEYDIIIDPDFHF